MTTKRFNISWPEPMLEKLEYLARINNVSKSTIVKLAVNDYIRKSSEDQNNALRLYFQSEN